MSAFPITTAQIVALFMESVAYGIYLVTFGMCLHALFTRTRTRSSVNWMMLVVALLMCTFATLDVAFGLRHNLDAFVYWAGSGGAAEEFADISYWVNVMKSADYAAQTIIGDGMLVYRCFHVWGRNWLIIVVPSLLLLACAACTIVEIVITATLDSSTLATGSNLAPWITSVICITFAQNILTTSLIVYKIWTISRDTAPLVSSSGSRGHTRLMYIVRIIVESGLIYTVAVLCFFGVYLAGSNALYGVSDVVVQVIGIVFNLIIIRTDRGQTFEATTMTTTLPPMKKNGRFIPLGAIRPDPSDISSKGMLTSDNGSSPWMDEETGGAFEADERGNRRTDGTAV